MRIDLALVNRLPLLKSLQFCTIFATVSLAGSACERPAPQGGGSSSASSAPAPAAQPAASSKAASPGDAAPPKGAGSGPAITFQTHSVDFGTISEVEQHHASFHFTNTGSQPLIIEQVKTSCGCTSAKLAKQQYAPGESGQIDIALNHAAPGNAPKIVNVISNAVPEPMSRLVLHARVLPFIDIQPRILETGVLAYRQEHHCTVTISCPQDANYIVESIKASNPHVTARLAPDSTTGTARAIDVTIAPTATWGNLFSTLEVTARARPKPDSQPIEHTSKIRIQGQVFGELRAEPDTFRFGAKPGESFVRTIRISRANSPFDLQRAVIQQADIPGTTVTVTKISPSEYDLTLRAVADQLRSLAQGRVAITTDVPGEEHLEIPIVGVVRITSPSVQ
jgi:hypothetical protein